MNPAEQPVSARPRLRVLLSAYACEPGKGSEPGVGWNVACEMARHHDVWVLTRANNRPAIEAELEKRPVPGIHFLWHDLPSWMRFWKRGGRGIQLYYYLWQLSAVAQAKKANSQVHFDVGHHITFVKYWAPSVLAFLPMPYVWGPVGGGESAPRNFYADFGARGITYEMMRSVARWAAESDPFVRLTARRAAIALSTTDQTAARLKKLKARHIRVSSESALSRNEIRALSRLDFPPAAGPVRFVSIGRLLHWKGFHLGIEAFARSGLEDAEYWIIGDGPHRRRLQALCARLEVASRVRFFGALPRKTVMSMLAQRHALVHPSLHDSGGWVCLEAMAAGRPVICLDLGGPAVQITPDCGIQVPATMPEETIGMLADAMKRLANDPTSVIAMGNAGKRRVAAEFSWARKGELFSELYRQIAASGQCRAHKSP